MHELVARIDAALRGLTSRGWQIVHPDPDQASWQIRQNGPQGTLRTIYAEANPYWLYFTLPVGSNGPEEFDSLRLCRDRFLCKYALNEAGLLLQNELPVEGLSRGDVYMTMDGLTRCADGLAVPDESHTAGNGAHPADEVEYFPRVTLDVYFKTLANLGWAVRRNLGTNHWLLHYKAAERPFDVYLSFNPSWAYFQIPMQADALPPVQRTDVRLCRYLLRLNEQIYWARFGLDADGRILLTLDMPIAALSMERFRLAARTLGGYAGDYAYEIQIMSELERDPELARLLEVG